RADGESKYLNSTSFSCLPQRKFLGLGVFRSELAEGQTVFNSRQDQNLFHGIANRRKLFQVKDSFSAGSGKLRPRRRRRFFGISQKADKHLITLRLLLQFDNVTVRTAQFSQLANTAKDKKRGTDGGAGESDHYSHHRNTAPAVT